MGNGITMDECLRFIGHGFPYEGEIQGGYVNRVRDISMLTVNVLDHIPAEQRAKIEEAMANATPSERDNYGISLWVTGGGEFFSIIGSIGQEMQRMDGSFRVTRGAYHNHAIGFKYYKTGWGGGSPARITTYSMARAGSYLRLGGDAVGLGMSALTAGFAYRDIFDKNRDANVLTYGDAIVGTAGVANTVIGRLGKYGARYGLKSVPVVGQGVKLYSWWRFWFDLGAANARRRQQRRAPQSQVQFPID